MDELSVISTLVKETLLVWSQPAACLELWGLFGERDCLLPALLPAALVSATLSPPLCCATGCRGDSPLLFRVCERGLRDGGGGGGR